MAVSSKVLWKSKRTVQIEDQAAPFMQLDLFSYRTANIDIIVKGDINVKRQAGIHIRISLISLYLHARGNKMRPFSKLRLVEIQFKQMVKNVLTLSQTSPCFYMSFENTVGKEEIAHNEQFLLFPSCFLPF